MKLPLALLLLLTVARAFAIDSGPAFDDPTLQARYDALTAELRCLQCRNESIADSPSDIAGDLRRRVRELIAAGKSDDEIRQFLVERYGDYILLNPPLRPTTWLLWAAPLLLLIAGGTAAGMLIARKSRLPEGDSPESEAGAP
jgi:cytochrome c-type biogenesis protein CcmH